MDTTMEFCARCGALLPCGEAPPKPEAEVLGPLRELGRVTYGMDDGARLCPRCRRELEHTGAALIHGDAC